MFAKLKVGFHWFLVSLAGVLTALLVRLIRDNTKLREDKRDAREKAEAARKQIRLNKRLIRMDADGLQRDVNRMFKRPPQDDPPKHP